MFDKTSLSYTRLFCEENIWKLVEHMNQASEQPDGYRPVEVLFLINPQKTVALYQQTAAPPGHPVIWDYHVILSARAFSGSDDHSLFIFDFDSRLPFPCLMQDYFEATFRDWSLFPEALRPFIRAINADDYINRFDSDRSHMLGVIEENQFPAYAAIRSIEKQRLELSDLFSTDALTELELYTPDEYLHRAVQY